MVDSGPHSKTLNEEVPLEGWLDANRVEEGAAAGIAVEETNLLRRLRNQIVLE